MESSALNVAHEKQRRAEAFLREARFQEAAESHEAIANLLLEVQLQLQANSNNHHTCTVLNSKNPIARLVTLESVALQQDYHHKQAQIVRMKQARYEEYIAKMKSHKHEMLNKKVSKQQQQASERLCEISDSTDEVEGSLHQAIYRTIEKQNNLLSLISLPDDDDKAFNKHPKDTSTVIEELRVVNTQLRSLIGNLLNQLEIKDQEIKKLKQQITSSSSSTSSSDVIHNDNNDEDEDNDNEEEEKEHNVDNNEGEHGEEKTALLENSIHSVHLEPLPPLAPLEMPRFDFNTP